MQGDFGTSMRTGQPVGPAMFAALGRSLLLAVFSIELMLILAIPLGIVAAVRRGKAADLLVSVLSYIGVVAAGIRHRDARRPVPRRLAAMAAADGLCAARPRTWSRACAHLVLPVAVVSVILIAHVSRMVRSELVDVLHTDYIRAARLKGLAAAASCSGTRCATRLLPTITIVALDVGYLLGGVIVVEEIFAIPGIGRAPDRRHPGARPARHPGRRR